MRYQIEIGESPRRIHEGTAESAIEAVGRHFYGKEDHKQYLVKRLESEGSVLCSYGFIFAEIRALP